MDSSGHWSFVIGQWRRTTELSWYTI